MSDESDSVWDEPIHSGPARTEFYGDAELAKQYLPQARRVLGGMRTIHGVNERIANGEPGGYYRTQRVLEDGTRIEAITNDGQDTLRITASSTPETSSSESDSFTPGDIPSPTFPEPKDAGGETAPGLDAFGLPVSPPVVEPYFWIGIRQMDHRISPKSEEPGVQLHVCLWEPEANDQPGMPMVLSNQWNWSDPDNWNPNEIPLRPNLVKKKITAENPISEEYAGQYGDVYYTPNLLYLVDRNAPEFDANKDLIYDPAPDPNDPVEWDFVFVLDPTQAPLAIPSEALHLPFAAPIYPADDRGILPDEAWFNETGIFNIEKILPEVSGEVPPEYVLKIMAVGDDCDPLPVKVRVDVMVLKDYYMMRETFEIDIVGNTQLSRGILPGGYKPNQSGGCGYNGTNPHRDHWWPGALIINPYLGVRREEQYLPSWGFVPNSGWPSRSGLCGSSPEANRYAYVFNLQVATKAELVMTDPGEISVVGEVIKPMKFVYKRFVKSFDNPTQAEQLMDLAVFCHDYDMGGIYIMSNHSGESRRSVGETYAAFPTTFSASDDYTNFGLFPTTGTGWLPAGQTREFTGDGGAAWIEAFGTPLFNGGGSSKWYVYDPRTNETTLTTLNPKYDFLETTLKEYLVSHGYTHAVYGAGFTIAPSGPPYFPFVISLLDPDEDDCA